MANTIRIKRRASSSGAGAPSSLQNAELAYNEASDILYYGTGTGGEDGTATQVIAIGGPGAFATKQTTLAGYGITDAVPSSAKGVANGVATLDSSGLVPSSQLPSYVDDVVEYNNLAGFPEEGETGKIYVDKATNKTYRWSGSQYTEISASPGSTDAVSEGSTNKYYTDARARAAISVTQNLTYDNSTGVITGPDLSGYLTSSSASSTYLTQSNASSTYLSQSDASSTYLTQSNASSTYQTQSGMSSYLTTSSASDTYEPKISKSTGFLTWNGTAWAWDTSTYLTTSSASSTYQTQSGMSSYLTTSSASDTYEPKISKSTGFLTWNGTTWTWDTSTYLTTSSASSTYLTQSNASSTYLTQSNASSTYQTQSGMSSYLSTSATIDGGSF